MASLSSEPIVISIDGNIGAGKSTLLTAIKDKLPQVVVIHEPVDTWTSLKNKEGKNLLELFYEDKKRWAYTFQNAAILTRLRTIELALQEPLSEGKIPVYLCERSVLTDRFVFAEMLKDSGDIDDLEWQLYSMWFDNYARRIPMKGIVHLTTTPETSKERITIRGRSGEDKISSDYLDCLDQQHNKWISNTTLPTLQISTEPGISVDENVSKIWNFLCELKTGNKH